MYRLKTLREDKDMSQAEVARIIHATQQHYSKIESGKTDISGERIILLAEFYGVSADYILGLSDDPSPKQ